MSAPSRPLARWHGGKWNLAPWIISHFPSHAVYVEPFGGGGSVLMRKPRAYAEVYNDLDREIVNLFTVLRDHASAAELEHRLRHTPFARLEFEAAYGDPSDPVEIARALVVRMFMGFGSDGHNKRTRTGFRANSNRSGTTPAHDWANYPDVLRDFTARLRGVVIEHRDAMLVMRAHDRVEALHYVDPPYLPSTRSTKSRRSGEKYHCYTHELTLEDHVELLNYLRSLSGMVVLSGYDSDLYNDALPGWERSTTTALADGARERTEILWLNPVCAARLRGKGTLFEACA